MKQRIRRHTSSRVEEMPEDGLEQDDLMGRYIEAQSLMRRRHGSTRSAAIPRQVQTVQRAGGHGVHRASGVVADEDRVFQGLALRLGVEGLSGLSVDGDEPAWVEFDAHCYDAQLSRMSDDDVALIEVDCDHEVPGIGRLLAVGVSEDALQVMGEVFGSPAGDMALDGLNDGTLGGLSVHSLIRQSVNRGTRDGLPRILVLEAELRAVSLCFEPADPLAVVETLGHQALGWRASMECAEQFVEMIKRRPHVVRARPTPRERWGVAPAFGP